MEVISNIMGTVERSKGAVSTRGCAPSLPRKNGPVHTCWHHRRGSQIRMSLSRESELNDGDVLALQGDVAIVVRAAPEQLFIIQPQGTR